jgi:DNA-binding MarR family transcriptional regulator
VTKLDLQSNPGFLFRRLQQESVSLFLERLRPFDITPLQYTILRVIEAQPGIDQVSVASQTVLDTSTVKDIIARLELKGLVERRADPHDRRSRAAFLTPAGAKLVVTIEPYVRRARKELLAPLSERQRAALLNGIRILLAARENPAGASKTAKPWRRFQNTANTDIS